MNRTAEQVAKMIDHSLLRPELTVGDVLRGCALAARYEVASVCVKPCDVAVAALEPAGSGVLVGTVVGFPHGSSASAVKAAEAAAAIADGARELDMVLNIGRLRGGADAEVAADIRAVVEAASGASGAAGAASGGTGAASGGTVKVIFENASPTTRRSAPAVFPRRRGPIS